jgi:FKBP-type peptidyl-prolyl cis-trans isomerase (trigger factor)
MLSQGSTDEQLQEMSSPENYEKYKQLSLKNVEKTVKLGLVFRDISEREKITVAEKEIQEQIDLLNAQAKQKGEGAVDPVQAR